MWFGLHGVDQIRELHGILNKEDRNVIADEVPVAFVGIELDREAAHIARGVGRTAFARHGGKAHEYRCALAGLGEQRGARNRGLRFETLEVSMSRGASRMNDALGNAFV